MSRLSRWQKVTGYVRRHAEKGLFPLLVMILLVFALIATILSG